MVALAGPGGRSTSPVSVSARTAARSGSVTWVESAKAPMSQTSASVGATLKSPMTTWRVGMPVSGSVDRRVANQSSL